MSTRSVIGRVGKLGKTFAGRYHHSDGMPTSLGKFLWDLYHGHFKGDLSKMLAYLIDAPHAVAGWSCIVGKDFTLKPGCTSQDAYKPGVPFDVYSKTPDYRRPQCFAGRKGETAELFTEKSLEGGTDLEWLYLFDEEKKFLFVRDVMAKENVACVNLDGDEPDWTTIECGEKFERCSHYAWVHNLLPKTSSLSTAAYLGHRELEVHDAVGFIVNGKKYRATGSGWNSEFMRSGHPAGTWVSTCIAGNNRRKNIPVAKILPTGEYKPLPGVQWVFPPTKKTPQITTVGQ